MRPSGTNTAQTQLWMSRPLMGPDLYRGGQSIRLPEGSEPRAASPPHAAGFIDSLVTCSSLGRCGAGRSSPPPCTGPPL